MSDDVLGATEEYVVDIDDIEVVEPLPKQDYIGEVLSIATRLLVDKDEVRVQASYLIPVEQYPPQYDIDNAPEGVKLWTPFNGTLVECGEGSQPTKKGMHDWRRFLKAHGYTGAVRFVRRDDLAGKWSVAEDILNELVGRTVKLTIDHNKNPNDGEVRAQIKTVAVLN